MAEDNAIKFIELLTSDSEIQEKLRDATAAYDGPKGEREVFDAVVAPIAAQAGLPFTFEEGVQYVSSERELNDAELDAVALSLVEHEFHIREDVGGVLADGDAVAHPPEFVGRLADGLDETELLHVARRQRSVKIVY